MIIISNLILQVATTIFAFATVSVEMPLRTDEEMPSNNGLLEARWCCVCVAISRARGIAIAVLASSDEWWSITATSGARFASKVQASRRVRNTWFVCSSLSVSVCVCVCVYVVCMSRDRSICIRSRRWAQVFPGVYVSCANTSKHPKNRYWWKSYYTFDSAGDTLVCIYGGGMGPRWNLPRYRQRYNMFVGWPRSRGMCAVLVLKKHSSFWLMCVCYSLNNYVLDKPKYAFPNYVIGATILNLWFWILNIFFLRYDEQVISANINHFPSLLPKRPAIGLTNI